MKEIVKLATNEFWIDFNAWYLKKGLQTHIPYDIVMEYPLAYTQGIFNAFLESKEIVILNTTRGWSVVHSAYKNAANLYDDYIFNQKVEQSITKNYKCALLYIVRDYPNSILPF